MVPVSRPSTFPRSTTTNTLEKTLWIPLFKLEAWPTKHGVDGPQYCVTSGHGTSQLPGKSPMPLVVVVYQACMGEEIFATFLACIGPSISPRVLLATLQCSVILVINS